MLGKGKSKVCKGWASVSRGNHAVAGFQYGNMRATAVYDNQLGFLPYPRLDACK